MSEMNNLFFILAGVMARKRHSCAPMRNKVYGGDACSCYRFISWYWLDDVKRPWRVVMTVKRTYNNAAVTRYLILVIIGRPTLPL